MARRRPATWTVILICGLLVAVAAIVWVLGDRTADQAREVDLTVPPIEAPNLPNLPEPEPPAVDPPVLPAPAPG